jgi:hypothetical protein
MMSEPRVTLTGLDGANPLAFLAALGTLRVLAHRARQHSRPPPRLSWSDEGCWRPVIHGPPSIDAIVGELLEDRDTWADDAAFLLAYDETGEQLVDPRKEKGKFTRDLKPKPAAMRAFVEDLAKLAAMESVAGEVLRARRSLDTAAVFGSEIVQDNNGNTKPTAFHFTAGQQQFMKAIAELQAGVGAADFEEALAGPWRRESTLPNMSWDATNARLYALRSTNPSGDKKTTVAGADWLAFVGLGMLPSFPCGKRLLTTGVKGGWKDSTFTWPVWRQRATSRVVGSLLRTVEETPASRQARGLTSVFSARISRSDQGGYGTFAPADVL